MSRQPAACIPPCCPACVVIHSTSLPFGRHFWGTGANLAAGYNPKIGTPKKRSRRRDSPRSWGSWSECRGFCSLRGQAFPSWPHHSPALAPCKCSRPLPHPALPGKLSPTNRLSSWLPLVSGPPRVLGGPMRVELTDCGGSGWPLHAACRVYNSRRHYSALSCIRRTPLRRSRTSLWILGTKKDNF